MALWLCSDVAMWLYGLCGYVAMWISSKIFEFFGSRISKDNIFQDVPIYFLILFEVFWYNKSHKYGVHGFRFDHLIGPRFSDFFEVPEII